LGIECTKKRVAVFFLTKQILELTKNKKGIGFIRRAEPSNS
jgi:hypothetical protein